jgi:hypothetical protein
MCSLCRISPSSLHVQQSSDPTIRPAYHSRKEHKMYWLKRWGLSRTKSSIRSQADVIYTSLPNKSYYEVVPAPMRPEKQKWYHLPLKRRVSPQLLLLSFQHQLFICTAVVHLAHTAVAVAVVPALGSSLAALLASESAGLLLLLRFPSCSARPVCAAGLGRIYRCGNRRPCRA